MSAERDYSVSFRVRLREPEAFMRVLRWLLGRDLLGDVLVVEVDDDRP